MPKILDPDLLTYIVDGSPSTQNIRINTTAKTIQLVAGGSLVAKDGVTGQCLFSKLKEIIKADAMLIKFPVPVREMIYDESLELVNGWTLADTTSLKMVRDCGLAYVNASGVTMAMFACFTSLGALAAGTTNEIYFVQDSATNATPGSFTHVNTETTFGVNELVQIYSDPNGDGSTADGYDRRSFAKLFLRRQGYTYDEASNIDIGYPTLTYRKYNFPVTHVVDAGVTESDVTVDAYTGMSITWYATNQSFSLGTNGPYNFRVVINANGRTYNEVYSWVQRQLRRPVDIDADGTGDRTGQVAPALVFMDGTTLKTRLQSTGGVNITNLAGASLNNVSVIDNTGVYRTYPYVAAITLEFDSFLQADGINAKFWIYDAATYGTAGATLLKDASNNDMTGTISGPTASFSYNYTGDKSWVGIAVGKDQAKIAEAAGTIVASTANKAVFVAGKERWYANP